MTEPRSRGAAAGVLLAAVVACHLATGYWRFLAPMFDAPRSDESFVWLRVQALVSFVFPFGVPSFWEWVYPTPRTAGFAAVLLAAPPILMIAYLVLSGGRTRAQARRFGYLLAFWLVVSVVFVALPEGLLGPLSFGFQIPPPSFSYSVQRTVMRVLIVGPYIAVAMLWLAPWAAELVLARLRPERGGSADLAAS